VESRLIDPDGVCENCGRAKWEHNFHHNDLVCPPEERKIVPMYNRFKWRIMKRDGLWHAQKWAVRSMGESRHAHSSMLASFSADTWDAAMAAVILSIAMSREPPPTVSFSDLRSP
jgi:hypothetical protein